MLFHRLLSQGMSTLCHPYSFRFIHRSARLDKLTTFKLSDIGEGISEVELVRWNKAIGDDVEEMEAVCTVQSDKAAVDITSRYTGIVKKLYVNTGEMIKIGSPLMDIDAEDEVDVETETAETAKEEKGEVAQAVEEAQSCPQRTASARVNASPGVRQLAKKLGVDLEKITPSDPYKGQITKEDVEKAAGTSAPKFDIPGEFIKLTPVGRGMVKSMVASLEIPHVTVGEDLDLTDLKAFYLKKRAEETEFKLTMTPFLLKGLSLALKEHPIMNSKFCGDGYMQFSVHNINVAVATEKGLLVPVIRNVESKNIRQLQVDLIELQKKSAEMKLRPEDMKDGTITLSNLGAIGGTYVKACLFDGQSAIIAMGTAKKQPCYIGDALLPREIAPMGVTADHRHLDGATIAQFAAKFKNILKNMEILEQHY